MKKLYAFRFTNDITPGDRAALEWMAAHSPAIKAANLRVKNAFDAYYQQHAPKEINGIRCLELPSTIEPNIEALGTDLTDTAKAFGCVHGVYLYRRAPNGTLLPIIAESFGGIDRPDVTDYSPDHYTCYRWSKPDADTPHRIQSITKSIASLILAAALQFAKKEMDSFNEKLSAFIPESEVEKLDTSSWKKAKIIENLNRISLYDVLNMSSGLLVPQDTIYSATSTLPPWCIGLQNDCVYPGKYSYADTDANILGKVIEQVTGKPFFEFAKEHLFSTLGILNPIAKYWTGNGESFFPCSGGFSLSPNDLAKIGQLVLQNGQWFDGETCTLDLSSWVETFKASYNTHPEESKALYGQSRELFTQLVKGYLE